MTDARPVLDQVNLVSRDVAASAAFYERLGVVVPAVPAPWGDHHVSLEAGDGLDVDIDSASFAGQWDRGWPAGSAGVVLGFQLSSRDQVDRTYADLTGAGYAGQQEPYDAFWGARYAVVEDPDGIAVGLMSPISAKHRAPPPTV